MKVLTHSHPKREAQFGDHAQCGVLYLLLLSQKSGGITHRKPGGRQARRQQWWLEKEALFPQWYFISCIIFLPFALGCFPKRLASHRAESWSQNRVGFHTQNKQRQPLSLCPDRSGHETLNTPRSHNQQDQLGTGTYSGG